MFYLMISVIFMQTCLKIFMQVYAYSILINMENILLYGVITLILSILDLPLSWMQRLYSKDLIVKYRSKIIEKYNKLDFLSRDNPYIFINKLNDYSDLMSIKISLSFELGINIISILISFAINLIKYNEIFFIFLMIIFNIYWIKYIILPNTIIINKLKKISKIYSKSLKGLISLSIERNYDYSLIIEKDKSFLDECNKINIMNTFMLISYQIPNLVVFCFVPLIINDKSKYTLLLILFIQINNYSKKINDFCNIWIKTNKDSKMIDDFFENKTFDKDLFQNYIPPKISFTGNIENGFLTITNKITIYSGNKILIKGKIGKSTLVRSLIGYINGIKYCNGYSPSSFINSITYMKQNMVNNIPFFGVTIRQLFYNENNNELIILSLNICNLIIWFNNEMNGEIDVVINDLNEITDLIKSKLSLAIIIYKLIKKDSKWLILDEPDKNIDVESFSAILKNIFNYFQDVTIFLISKLCKCENKKLGFISEWIIENGDVREELIDKFNYEMV